MSAKSIFLLVLLGWLAGSLLLAFDSAAKNRVPALDLTKPSAGADERELNSSSSQCAQGGERREK